METVVINKKNKKIKLLSNLLEKEKSGFQDKMILFIDGLENLPTPHQEENFSDLKGGNLFEFLSIENGIPCAKFRWYCSSLSNNNYKNIKIKGYINEIKIVLNYIKKININNVIIITNSFGSVPAFFISQLRKYNVEKIIFQGPVFENSIQNLKHRLKREDSFIYQNSKINKVKVKNKLIKDWTDKTSKSFFIANKNNFCEYLIFQGENELEASKLINESFIRRNGGTIHTIKNAGHLIYMPSKFKDDDDFRKKQNEIFSELQKEIYKFIN